MKSRVAITGMGLITCLGEGIERNWDALVSGRSGIGNIERFPTVDLRTRFAGTVDSLRLGSWSKEAYEIEIGRRALSAALQQAGLAGERREPLYIGYSGIEWSWDQRLELARRAPESSVASFKLSDAPGYTQAEAPTLLNTRVVNTIADSLHVTGPLTSVTTACASGATAIQLGEAAIRDGRTEIALVGATDCAVTPEYLVRFSLLSALSQRNDEPKRASRPFSASRDGFVMAEGAAFLVLEDEQSARSRGAKILAFLMGSGSSADGFHRTRSRPDGSSGARCIIDALRSAEIDPEDVHYVNAHGTSTPENDRMETHVLKRVFGDHARNLAISSNKSMIGHTLSAAGAVEAVITALSVQRGIIPPTINLDDPDPELDLNYVPNESVRREIPIAISNSFGFGGQNVTLVLGAA